MMGDIYQIGVAAARAECKAAEAVRRVEHALSAGLADMLIVEKWLTDLASEADDDSDCEEWSGAAAAAGVLKSRLLTLDTLFREREVADAKEALQSVSGY